MYIKEACLSVCLFGFGAQTTEWIPTKFGMDLPLDPVGYLKILFWVGPLQGGYNFGKAQKIQPFLIWPRTDGRILLRHLLRN